MTDQKNKSELQEHQKRVLKRLDKNNAVVVAHGMGSGKTLTALHAAAKAHQDDPEGHVTMIVPSSLVSNVHDQRKQHGVELDENRFHVTTYDKAVNDIDKLKRRKHSLVILDEAHKIRNTDTARSKELSKVLKKSDKTMLLSGTPSYNKPHEIAVLINRAAGEKVLPDDEKDFESRYIGRRKVHPGFFAKHFLGVQHGEVHYLKNQDELRDKLKKYVDTYDAQNSNAGDFPTVHHKTVKVHMDDKQQKVYKFLEGNMPAPMRWKIRMGLPLDKKESSNLNAFSSGVRQASNHPSAFIKGEEGYVSPKLQKMADHLQDRHENDHNHRAVVYSNYLEAGLHPYSKELTKRGIPHAIYHGGLNKTQKDEIVDKYNRGEIKNLLVSSSGSEGLNLKGTKYMQIMEPHFNKSKISQVVARGVRYHSHSHLPEDERHMDVEHFHSVSEPGTMDKIMGTKMKTIDEYLHETSNTKEKVKEDIMNMVKAAGDKNIFLEKIAEMKQQEVPKSLPQIIVDRVTNPVGWALRGQGQLLGAGMAVKNIGRIESQLIKLKHQEQQPSK